MLKAVTGFLFSEPSAVQSDHEEEEEEEGEALVDEPQVELTKEEKLAQFKLAMAKNRVAKTKARESKKRTKKRFTRGMDHLSRAYSKVPKRQVEQQGKDILIDGKPKYKWIGSLHAVLREIRDYMSDYSIESLDGMFLLDREELFWNLYLLNDKSLTALEECLKMNGIANKSKRRK